MICACTGHQLPDGERHLAAIMFTDIVGFAALTQRNESNTIRLLDEHRALVRPLVSGHGGREIKTIGDAFLIEFHSALDAVLCSIAIQQMMHDRNVARSETLSLRIGIHVGDVLERGNDILGDAVNIASRIEPLANPGGVCISSQVYEQVRNKSDLLFIPLGEKSLKNLDLPISVYAVRMPWEPPSSTEAAGFPTTRIAILPFRNMSPDPNDEYFAEGMTEEVISTVSGIRGLSVISRTSVMGYKGTSKKVKEIGRDLEVGSILEGSFRKAGARIRVTTQLIKVASDDHLWAQSYDREFDDVFAVQSDIAQKVAESMKLSLLETDKARVMRVPTRNMLAYESYLQGVYQFNKGSVSSVKESIGYLENAIRQDPTFSQAYAVLGNYLVALAGEVMPLREAFEKAEPLIAKALELDDSSSEAHLASGNLALQYRFDWRLAEAEFDKAIELNPNNAAAYAWRSVLHCLIGDLDKALEEASRARELDPLSTIVLHSATRCMIAKRLYAEAIAMWQRMAQLEPNVAHIHVHLAELFCLAGDAGKAEKEAAAARRLQTDSEDRILLVPVYSLLGKKEEARALMQDLQTGSQSGYTSPTRLAAAFLAIGDRDKALGVLEDSFREDRTNFLFGYQDPSFDSIRENPRFASLVTRLNLPR